MNKEIYLLKRIYNNPGTHLRSLSRELNIGIPSVKYGLEKLISKKLITSEKEGRNKKFYVNYRSKLIIPYLYIVEYSRILKLPKNVQDAIFHLMDCGRNKVPIITIVFGSYAIGDHAKKSDLDILLVYNEIDKEKARWLEGICRIISHRHGIQINPIYIDWREFHKKLYGRNDDFMNNVRKNKILISGIEWWILMEGKCYWGDRI